ncbi:unnamed protein product [Hymenolepis diminuta]|uniref:Uncharacterized protein n=1 Tax=Hymenolepis diminuta TaxID=6216 RepID=A0A0R3SCD6_HYMDI|nr:unnamed protein product [Hymenolepis diminuta]
MDIVMQLCQNLATKRPHSGSLPASGVTPQLAHRPLPHHHRDSTPITTLLQIQPDPQIIHALSQEYLPSITYSSTTLRPPSPETKRGKHSVSFSCETVSRQPSQESSTPEFTEKFRKSSEEKSGEEFVSEETTSDNTNSRSSHRTLPSILNHPNRSRRSS